MIVQSRTTAPARKPAVDRIYAYLAETASKADLSQAKTASDQFLHTVRYLAPKYGLIGDQITLDGVTVTPVDEAGIGGARIKGEWVVAEGASPDRRMVWIHGGGWVCGDEPDYHRLMAATISRQSGFSVFLVNYRLAPEHRFPAGLEDCFDALDRVSRTAPDGSQRRAHELVLGGDSAGGNLAGATCLLTVERGARVPDRLVIVAGMMDNVTTYDRHGPDDPVCAIEGVDASCALYLPDGVANDHPHVSPVYASAEHLAQFPPTLIQASSTETLFYDCRRFASRLEEAHVRAVFSVWPGMPHVWHAFQNVLPEAREALAEIVAFMRPA